MFFRNIRLFLLLGGMCCILGCGHEDLPKAALLSVQCVQNERAPLLDNEYGALSDEEKLFTTDFVLTNESINDISIELKSTSCGCLNLERDGFPIKEGDVFLLSSTKSTVITISTQVGPYAGKYELKSFFTYGEAVRDTPLVLSIKYWTLRDISIDPRIIRIEHGKDSSEVQRFSVNVTRVSRNKNDLRDALIPPNLPEIVALQKTSVISDTKEISAGIWEKQWQYDFTAKLDKHLPLSEKPEIVYFSTSENKPPTEQFSLIFSRTSGLGYPRQVQFSDTKVSQKQTRTISINSFDGTAFEIISLSCKNAEFSAAFESKALKQHWLNITFSPKLHGDFVDRLEIETNHPSEKKLSIELAGTGVEGEGNTSDAPESKR